MLASAPLISLSKPSSTSPIVNLETRFCYFKVCYFKIRVDPSPLIIFFKLAYFPPKGSSGVLGDVSNKIGALVGTTSFTYYGWIATRRLIDLSGGGRGGDNNCGYHVP